MRGADGAVRFGQIDSDEHYRLSDRPTSGDYLFCREVGRLDDDGAEPDSQESDRVRVPELQSSAEIDRGKRRVAASCRCIETRAS